LAQIRSAVPEIFHTQTKNPQTDGAKNRTFRSSLPFTACGKKPLAIFKPITAFDDFTIGWKCVCRYCGCRKIPERVYFKHTRLMYGRMQPSPDRVCHASSSV